MICARYGRASTGRKRLRAHRVWLTAVLAFGLSGADAGPVRVGFGRAALPALEGAPTPPRFGRSSSPGENFASHSSSRIS